MSTLPESLHRYISALSIGRKLMLITVSTTVLIFIGTLLVYVFKEFGDMHREESEQQALIAALLGRNLTAAVAFRDQAAAGELLSSLSAKPSIARAELTLPDGSLFSQYTRESDLAVQKYLEKTHPENYQRTTVEVVQNGPALGRLTLVADISLLLARQWELVGTALAILVAGVILTLILGQRLQRIITTPVTALTEAMGEVTRSQNFGLRLSPSTEDELGHLVRGFNAMLEELSDRDEKLSRYQQSLEQQVSERTQALSESNRELQQTIAALESAKSRAESVNRAKTQFLANMSHELRTPMNGVLGMIEVLLTTQLNENQKHYCTAIRHSGESLLGLISNILDLSKIEAGKLDISHEPLHLPQLVEETGEIFALSLSEKGIELITSIAPHINRLYYGDSLRLRQVLINLIGNAAKFTRRGTISVRVSRVNGETPERQFLRFEIADTGIGISPEAKARIFDAFTQADSSTTRQFGGTGLGLTISRDLVHLMGGELEVQSEPGQGSVFAFTLPFAPGPLFELELHERFGDLRVLVVDPTLDSRRNLQNTLMSWGIKAEVLPRNGEDELELAGLKGRPIDVVLLDDSPRGRGLPSRTALEALAVRQGLILLSHRDDHSADYASLSLPVFSLLKPIRRSALYNSLLKLVHGEAPAVLGGAMAALELDVMELPQFGARILLAEDSRLNQEVAVTMLKLLGCTTEVAENGEEALEALARQRYDLVLMDCQMPIMDGYEATRRLRQLSERTPPVLAGELPPIIAVTAHAVSGDREACLEAGMDDYLAKPYRYSELVAVLERWLGRPAREAQDYASPDAQAGAAPPVSGPAPTPDSHAEQDPMAALKRRVDQLYLLEVPTLLAQIQEGLGKDDVKGVYMAAHTLKSSSATVGQTGLSSFCRGYEELAKSGDLARLREQEAELARQCHLAVAAVTRQLGA